MQVRDYLNISKEDIDSKNRNIFIPVCLGNKFFSENGILSQNIKDYLDWAFSNTKEKVLFIIVDRIQDTNFFEDIKRGDIFQRVQEKLPDTKTGVVLMN